ncbi:YccF domain-containing protein [Suttonella ornithocola]|uniref:Inner membrane protein YccF n=1 Tax=Suttonella ornithocola TaxID=279832 RepID=A0A380MY69_9GAMM|nr:YccF domain-containing protein [Suttonella ornithocola]SUO96843.1 Inner membrane protein yccF [Suttonella ornithocola]
MRFILNILWVVMGGFLMSLGWLLSAFLMALTVVGLPWVPACIKMARFVLWPFGYQAVDNQSLGKEGLSSGPLGCIGNLIWLILAGWWLALGHLIAAVANFVTIIGIPFGWQHLKMIRFSLAPIGMSITPIKD